MSGDDDSHHYNHIPRYVKIIILAQAATILSFTFGMYEEYLSNPYLQQYVISLFTSNVIPDAVVSIVTASVFALGTFTLLGSMRTGSKKREEWKTPMESGHPSLELPSMPFLEIAPPTPVFKKTGRRPRQRRPRSDSDKVYRQMIRYTSEHEEYPKQSLVDD